MLFLPFNNNGTLSKYISDPMECCVLCEVFKRIFRCFFRRQRMNIHADLLSGSIESLYHSKPFIYMYIYIYIQCR